MSTQNIEELFENTQFLMMLRDQVEKIVSTTITERSETRYTIEIVDEIHDLVGKMIEYSIKDQASSLTNDIHSSIVKFHQEGEKAIQEMTKRVEEENSSFKKDIQQTIKEIKKQLMDDKLRMEQKISNLNKNSTETITNKIRDITNNFDQNFPKSMKSIKMLPFSTKLLPELDNSCSDELKDRLKEFEKRIQEIEIILIDIENRLHERYEVNITSLWTVVAELEGKLLTEDKVESKLDQLKGSFMVISSQITKQQQQKKQDQSKVKKWFKLGY